MRTGKGGGGGSHFENCHVRLRKLQLHLEQYKCLVLQEGFLLGEITSRITDTISDAQLHSEKQETNLSERMFRQ